MSELNKKHGSAQIAIPRPYAKSYIVDMLIELRDMAGLCDLPQTENLLALVTEAAKLADGT